MNKHKKLIDEMPKISVIMSTFDEPKRYIMESIESILNQTYKNIEFIVIIDNPLRNDIVKIAKEKMKNDKRIILIEHKKNIGLTASLNEGISTASGDYIARMDADDVSIADRLEVQLNYLKNNELDLVGSNIINIDKDGVRGRIASNYPTNDNVIKKFIKIDSPIPHPTWLAKAEIIRENMYINFPACEDYELLARLAIQGKKFGNIKKPKLYYRNNLNGISSTKKVLQKTSKYYICKEYKNNKTSSLEEFDSFVKSSAGVDKIKSLECYYNRLIRIRKQNNRVKVFLMSVALVLTSNEAKAILKNKLQKRWLRIKYRKKY